jgi:hypothetical protein
MFLGAIGHPDVKPGILEVGILLKTRFALDQSINLRPVKLYPNVETPGMNIINPLATISAGGMMMDTLGEPVIAKAIDQAIHDAPASGKIKSLSAGKMGCLGRRMNEGALNLVENVLPEVPLRQFVLTVPFPLRFPLAFNGKLLGQVLRIFTDTVAGWYRRRHIDRGLSDGEPGAATVIQRANSDLRLNPHFHSLFLDGVYSPDGDGKGHMFHSAPAPSQQEIETLVCRASKRILRFLQHRGIITPVTAPGDGEVTVVGDESLGEKNPLLAKLLADDRLKILDDGAVRLDFKKPWSDGTTSVELEPLALIARLAALVPPPKRHLTRYFGVLSSHAASRSEVVSSPAAPPEPAELAKPASKSRYIPWAALLRKTFGFEILCTKCKGPLRLIALIKSEDVAKRILTALHLPVEVPELHPARPPPGETGGGDDWLN